VFTGPPQPLAVKLLPVPPLDPDLIPSRLRAWVVDIATRGCFPLEFPAVTALVELGTLVGRQLGIRPKRHDNWLVVPNLWGGVIGPPSIQKTPAVEEPLLPMKRIVADAIKDHEERLEEFRVKEVVAKARAKAAKDELEKAAKKKRADLDTLAREALAGPDDTEPVLKRYLLHDTTVEKLGEILAENPNGVLVYRDELTGFLRSLDRPGHEGDRSFYLEAWAGLGSFSYDRIGRGTIHMPSVCVSVFGTIQPGPLARYIRDTLLNNDGLLVRFQLFVYPDPPGAWVNVDRYPDAAAKNTAYAVFKALPNLNTQGCERDQERDIPFLRFAPDAQDLFDEWRADLENRLRAGDHPLLIQEHIGKYRSLMPSLALLVHLAEVVPQEGTLPPVSLAAAEVAAAWCDVLEAHAKRIYRAGIDGDPEAAARLRDHLRDGLPNPFRARDVRLKGWAGLSTPSEVEFALGVLEDRGWVASRDVPAGPAGGRPTTEYWKHPDLLKGTP
jgi:putative DNA primase/helicase